MPTRITSIWCRRTGWAATTARITSQQGFVSLFFKCTPGLFSDSVGVFNQVELFLLQNQLGKVIKMLYYVFNLGNMTWKKENKMFVIFPAPIWITTSGRHILRRWHHMLFRFVSPKLLIFKL